MEGRSGVADDIPGDDEDDEEPSCIRVFNVSRGMVTVISHIPAAPPAIPERRGCFFLGAGTAGVDDEEDDIVRFEYVTNS